MKIQQVYKGPARNKPVWFVSNVAFVKQYVVPDILCCLPLQI